MMKKENIAALGLGIIAAALLWHYYLGPKYLIKRGDEATLQALHEADLKALQEAIEDMGGDEIIARSDVDYAEEEAAAADGEKDDVLNARSREEVDFEYYSTAANRPRSLMEMAAAGDKPKDVNVRLEDGDITVSGKITHDIPEGYITEEIAQTEDGVPDLGADPKGRFTMLIAPVKHHLFRDAAAYNKFLAAQRKGMPYPKVDFKKDMIVLLESDGQLANGFFQIDKTEEGAGDITISYKLNIIGSAERSDIMAHTVLPKSGKNILLQQVK